jgi:hypothetical protein
VLEVVAADDEPDPFGQLRDRIAQVARALGSDERVVRAGGMVDEVRAEASGSRLSSAARSVPSRTDRTSASDRPLAAASSASVGIRCSARVSSSLTAASARARLRTERVAQSRWRIWSIIEPRIRVAAKRAKGTPSVASKDCAACTSASAPAP